MRALVCALLCICATEPMCAKTAADAAGPAANMATVQGFAAALYVHHEVNRAFETYAAPDMIQHNPAAQDGRAAAIALCAPLFTAPGASFGVEHVILDHDLAFIHFHGIIAPGQPGAAVAELYRLQGHKLVEHWDAFQPVPQSATNTHPMFGTIGAGLPQVATGATAEDRRAIAVFADLFYTQRNVAAAFHRFVASDYIQHNPNIADGREAAITALTPLFSRPTAHFDIRHVLVGGGYAVVHVHAWSEGSAEAAAVFDIFRLRNGKIVEHWDVLQQSPLKSVNPRPPA
jgi:predicted SnoaL-like aldol condensation-catalyzing enzyme